MYLSGSGGRACGAACCAEAPPSVNVATMAIANVLSMSPTPFMVRGNNCTIPAAVHHIVGANVRFAPKADIHAQQMATLRLLHHGRRGISSYPLNDH
jgi:hypothetical protein